MARRRGECHYCHKPLRGDNATKDHIVPKSLGGVDAQWNIVPSCKQCNHEKSNAMPNCGCAKCLYAILMWESGVRRGAGQKLIQATGDGSLDLIERREFEPETRGQCLLACRMNGCVYPTRCFAKGD